MAKVSKAAKRPATVKKIQKAKVVKKTARKVAPKKTVKKDKLVLIKRPSYKNAPVAKWHKKLPAVRQGPLTRDQVKKFYKEGFLLIPEFYSKKQLAAAKRATERSIDNLAKKLLESGKIKSLYAEFDWRHRLMKMAQDWPDVPVVLHKNGVLENEFLNMFTDKKMQDLVAQLGLAPDLALSPIWNLRTKMPSHAETVVPWHQDNSYYEERTWDEPFLTIWTPLVDATVENGCMQVVKGAHVTGKTAKHTVGTTTNSWYTELSEQACAKELLGKRNGTLSKDKDIVTCDCKAGSILIFPGTAPHRSLQSFGGGMRWSLDFRYHRTKAARPGVRPLDWFFGMKDSVIVRDGVRPDSKIKPDWKSWQFADRTDAQMGEHAKEFDPIITGPWMDMWQIDAQDSTGKPNRHVQSYLDKMDPKTKKAPASTEIVFN